MDSGAIFPYIKYLIFKRIYTYRVSNLFLALTERDHDCTKTDSCVMIWVFFWLRRCFRLWVIFYSRIIFVELYNDFDWVFFNLKNHSTLAWKIWRRPFYLFKYRILCTTVYDWLTKLVVFTLLTVLHCILSLCEAISTFGTLGYFLWKIEPGKIFFTQI